MTIKNVARIFNWSGILSAIWLFFFPVFYKFSVLSNILIPIIGVFLAFKHQEKIGIDTRKWDNTPIPKIDSGILFPSFALILRATIDIKIIGFKSIFIYSLIISIPPLLLLFLSTKEYLIGTKIFSGLIWAILFIFTFGCGTTILSNAIFDNSKPKIYKSKIINKEIEQGKGTYYRVDFEPWGPITENDIIRVSKSEFEKLKVNDSIALELKKGFLGTKWIYKK